MSVLLEAVPLKKQRSRGCLLKVVLRRGRSGMVRTHMSVLLEVVPLEAVPQEAVPLEVMPLEARGVCCWRQCCWRHNAAAKAKVASSSGEVAVSLGNTRLCCWGSAGGGPERRRWCGESPRECAARGGVVAGKAQLPRPE